MTERPPRILLVDDEQSIQTLLSYPLRKEGYEVVQASDGREALERFGETTFDLVILDVVLAEGDGYELVRALGADPQTADLDLIVYSADDVAAHDRPRLTLGRTQFVTKAGVDLAGVEERVLQLLQTDSTRPKDGT